MLKKIVCFLCALCSQFLVGQTKADDIIGNFLSPDKDGVMQFFKTGTTYSAKLIWSKDKERLDYKNPKPELRNQKVLGTIIAHNFVFNGKDTWENGTIYDPTDGKTYDCKITLDEKNNMKLRGYVGISLFGRTAYMVRMEDPSKK
jgi:uncharacterized protein (DUF2147 family)